MALPKLCYRTVSSNNFEPSKCVGATCSMWGEVGGLDGCLPALVATFQCIEIMDRQSAKHAEREAEVPKTDYEKDQDKLKERVGEVAYLKPLVDTQDDQEPNKESEVVRQTESDPIQVAEIIEDTTVHTGGKE